MSILLSSEDPLFRYSRTAFVKDFHAWHVCWQKQWNKKTASILSLSWRDPRESWEDVEQRSSTSLVPSWHNHYRHLVLLFPSGDKTRETRQDKTRKLFLKIQIHETYKGVESKQKGKQGIRKMMMEKNSLHPFPSQEVASSTKTWSIRLGDRKGCDNNNDRKYARIKGSSCLWFSSVISFSSKLQSTPSHPCYVE